MGLALHNESYWQYTEFTLLRFRNRALGIRGIGYSYCVCIAVLVHTTRYILVPSISLKALVVSLLQVKGRKGLNLHNTTK